MAENGSGIGADFNGDGGGTDVNNSLLGTDPIGGFGGSSVTINVEPHLSSLGDYGGPTETVALFPGSAGIGKGVTISGLGVDQRGFSVDTPTPDIGAFQTHLSYSLVVQSTGDDGAPAGEFDLRGAIDMAGVLGGVQAITFDPTVFATAQTINLTAGQLGLSSGSATITAPAAGVTISGGGGASSVFQIDSGATAVFSGGITLTCGSSSLPSNVVFNQGTLQIDPGVSFGTGTIINDGSLIFDRTDSSTVFNAIVGTGSLTVEGGGSVTLSGTDTDTGSISVADTGTELQSATNQATAPASVSGFGTTGTGWKTNKSGNFTPTITNNLLELTDGNNSEGNSAFDTTAVPTTGNFVASFTYTATSSGFPNNGADGVAFVLQDSAAGDTALGGGGGGLGASGIAGPGLVLSFNIYQPSTVGRRLLCSRHRQFVAEQRLVPVGQPGRSEQLRPEKRRHLVQRRNRCADRAGDRLGHARDQDPHL